MRLPPVSRALAVLLLASAACSPPPPADPAIVTEWNAATLAASEGMDSRARERLAALGALAMYEALSAAEPKSLRSLGGQVNGLWSVPPASAPIDGAIAAAEAQRVVLDSLLGANARARALVDSVAAAQVTARRAVGVAEDLAARSVAYGATLARAVLALDPADAKRTLVLRHPQECSFKVAARQASVTPQGAAEASSAPLALPLLAAAESRILEALARADSAAAVAREPGETGECVRTLIRSRLRTRDARR